MTVDTQIIDHYGGTELLAAITAGLAELGMDPTAVDALAPVDEFHIGGRPAATELCAQLELGASHHVLDVGCGTTGPCSFTSA